MSTAEHLRKRLDGGGILSAPGVYDALTAKLAQAAGFAVVYMTGYGTAAAHGHADVGILGLEEMAANVERIARAVSVPLIADADTGYDNVAETIAWYETAGAAGLHLEDQSWPKKCGHMDDKSLIPLDDMVAKLRAAAAARTNCETVIVARTDAIAVEGFDSALQRAAAYAKAGADMLFVEAPTTGEQIEAIPRELPGIPHIYNIAPKSPGIAIEELDRLGYALAIFPGICFTATMRACQTALADLRSSGLQANLPEWREQFDAWNRFLEPDE